MQMRHDAESRRNGLSCERPFFIFETAPLLAFLDALKESILERPKHETSGEPCEGSKRRQINSNDSAHRNTDTAGDDYRDSCGLDKA